MRDDLDYAAIRRQVEADLRREQQQNQKLFFVGNLITFLVFMVGAWFVLPNVQDVPLDEATMLMTLTVSIGWAVGLLLHWFSLYYATSERLQQDTRRRLMQRAVQDAQLGLNRELDTDGQREKAKRGLNGQLVLSDEGELLEIVAEDDLSQKRENRP
ncbi:MAG TPA: hypothetical protein VHO69_15760 [Phototrophicaceae bacterium]|nr:hypothetical protein [Phototrophicaceae bacterium]